MRPAAILIADDDAVSARQLSDILSREGHRVRVVDSGDAALRSCAVDPADVLVIDLIAHGHGFDVCRR